MNYTLLPYDWKNKYSLLLRLDKKENENPRVTDKNFTNNKTIQHYLISLSVTCNRLVVFTGNSGFLHQGWFGLWCLMPLSKIFELNRGCQFYLQTTIKWSKLKVHLKLYNKNDTFSLIDHIPSDEEVVKWHNHLLIYKQTITVTQSLVDI